MARLCIRAKGKEKCHRGRQDGRFEMRSPDLLRPFPTAHWAPSPSPLIMISAPPRYLDKLLTTHHAHDPVPKPVQRSSQVCLRTWATASDNPSSTPRAGSSGWRVHDRGPQLGALVTSNRLQPRLVTNASACRLQIATCQRQQWGARCYRCYSRSRWHGMPIEGARIDPP